MNDHDENWYEEYEFCIWIDDLRLSFLKERQQKSKYLQFANQHSIKIDDKEDVSHRIKLYILDS